MLQRPNRVIGVAASAGGVETLQQLVRQLPADLDAALCVVLHIPSTGRSLLAPILNRVCQLDVVVAEHDATIRSGVVYVAPADRHLLVHADRVELSSGPKENGVRPAADPMFRSLARAWGASAVAVVLSGALDDGAAGALAVAQSGGHVIVQDPEEALVPGMPASALAVSSAHDVLPVGAMGAVLSRLVGLPGTGVQGDALTIDAQSSAVEAALWTALEVLEERGERLRRIATRSDGQPRTQRRFVQGADLADERSAVIRRILQRESEVTG
ncbi:chemotaxis protein CheB [Solirubrobacter ginsenosidimutans]|uniref:protein-glutamate methylesterase n=1 Tax=Solirubrobacter ginsenosidimutans TaxID=490573 RepID=A0A9X3S435_9ACTN|nr:chemotaxis protein CheB [Solirubrobacter ginsenosidimutans]MDA0166335.1 chemotaxis protein CheB [Solirubrobacter ginsenosidimutans]